MHHNRNINKDKIHLLIKMNKYLIFRSDSSISNSFVFLNTYNRSFIHVRVLRVSDQRSKEHGFQIRTVISHG